MKRVLPFLLAFLLLALAACVPAPEAPSQDVSVPVSPAPSSEAESSPPVVLAPSPAPEEEPAVDGFIFADGLLLGACPESGGWLSAHEATFTLGQLFNRTYYDPFGEPLSAVRFFIADGPGALPSYPECIPLLDPFGVIEGDDIVMDLPSGLTGDAASLAVPNYSFSALFNGQRYNLLSDRILTTCALSFADTNLPDETVTAALASVGISCDLPRMERVSRACDLDGDGVQETTLELIQTPQDESGYAILEEGDPIFYALLLSEGDTCTVVTSNCIDYTTDLTAQFDAELHSVCDLNGDGSPEIILRQRNWEWGHISAFTKTGDRWTEVLRAEYGT